MLLLLAATSAFPQTTDACRERTVVVNVRDQQGQLTSGLLPKNFDASFRGQPVRVLAASAPTSPARIVLMVDGSASIALNGHTWEIARLIAGDLIAASPTSTQIALVVFASEVVEVLDFNTSHKQVLDRLRDLQNGTQVAPKGKRQTGLLDAVLRATQLFGKPLAGDAIYAITDGSDNHSHSSENNIQQAMLTRGIRFFAFYLTESYFYPSEEIRAGVDLLQNLALQSGGAVLDIPSNNAAPLYDLSSKGRERMAKQLNYLYDLIAHFYQLELELPVPVDKKRHWDLKVVDDQGKEQKKLTLFYPQELMPCDAASGHP